MTWEWQMKNFLFYKKTIILTHCILWSISTTPMFGLGGGYVGGSLGGHLSLGNQDGYATSSVRTVGIDSFPADPQNNLFNHGAYGMLYAGYGASLRPFYLAVDGFVQFGSIKLQSDVTKTGMSTNSPEVYNTLASTDFYLKGAQYGVDLLPGFSPIAASLVYARIGLSSSQATLVTDTTNGGVNLGDNWNQPLNLSDNKTFTSIRLGAGLEQRLSKRLTFRGDYIFTNYGRLSTKGFLSNTSALGRPITVGSSTEIRLYDHAAMLGLSYSFSALELLNLNPFCTGNAYEGLYIGGACGGGALGGKQEGGLLARHPTFTDLTQAPTVPSQLYSNQIQGALFLGYGRSWSKFYFGSELYATANSDTTIDGQTEAQFNNSDIAPSLHTATDDISVGTSTWIIGLDLRPGVLLTPSTLLFGRVGVGAAEIMSDASARFVGVVPLIRNWDLSQDSSAQAWKPALRVGLGIEQQIFAKLHLRADYIFTNYGEVSFDNSSSGVDDNGDSVFLSNFLSTRLQNNAVSIGLSYYFK